MSALTDIDSLVLMVRDKESKKLIEEAIAAYRGGALRSAIVATWICAIYDAISKLRELKENGDNAAANLIEEIDTAIDRDNVNKMQNIERDMFSKYFCDMQLISKYESEIFEQLQRDRHRCAHPAQDRDSIIFRPSTEAVRAYIVHTLSTLLIHAPLHGKHAIEKFHEQIFSEYFPKHLTDARIFIQERFLKYAKEIFITSLIKMILSLPFSQNTFHWKKISRLGFALRVIQDESSELFQNTAKPYIKSKYTKIIDDESIRRLIIFIHHNKTIWEWLPESTKSTVREFIIYCDKKNVTHFMFKIIDIRCLYDVIVERFKKMDADYQRGFLEHFKSKHFINFALDELENVACYADANAVIINFVIPLVEEFSNEDVDRIFSIYIGNSQVFDSNNMDKLFESIFEKCNKYNFNGKINKLLLKKETQEESVYERKLRKKLEHHVMYCF